VAASLASLAQPATTQANPSNLWVLCNLWFVGLVNDGAPLGDPSEGATSSDADAVDEVKQEESQTAPVGEGSVGLCGVLCFGAGRRPSGRSLDSRPSDGLA
jgi:hypothetical protein